jgi:hypothetical protein
VVRKRTAQGLSTESTWSRGQAWALHGFTIAYREAADPRFLVAARRTSDYFIDHLPADKVPYWDFDAADPGQPKDSSAAAIAASGLLELSRLEPDGARAQRYFATARTILSSLSSTAYLARGTSSRAVLQHGTGSKPAGDFDHGYVFGDYYFVEALLRYKALTGDAATRGGIPAGAPGSALEVRVSRKWRSIRTLLRRGIPVRVRTDRTGRLYASLAVGRRTARRLRISRTTRIARGRKRARRPGWTTVRVRPTHRARRALRRVHHRLRVRLRVVFAVPGPQRLRVQRRLVLRGLRP